MYQKKNNIFSIVSLYTKDYKKKIYLREISKLTNLPVKTIQNLPFSFSPFVTSESGYILFDWTPIFYILH